MAWPPTTHQDVQDAVTARAVIGDVGTSGTPTGDALRAAYAAVFAVNAVPNGSTDNTAAIQAALNACHATGGGTVRIYPAASGYKVTGELTVYSNTVIDARGATINLVGSAGRLLRNSALGGSGSRDTNITVQGGTWTRDSTSADEHLLVFHRIDGVTVQDAAFTTGHGKYAVLLSDATRFQALHLNLAGVYSDGVHVQGPASNGLIDGVTGSTGDDFVAVGADDYPQYQLTTGGGNVSGIVVRNLNATSADGNICHIWASSNGPTIRNLLIDGVSGTTAANGVSLDDSGAANDIDGITVRNVQATVAHGYALVQVDGSGVKSVLIDGVTVSQSDVTVYGVMAQPALVGQALTIRNLTMNTTLDHTGVVVQSGASLGSLVIDGFVGNMDSARANGTVVNLGAAPGFVAITNASMTGGAVLFYSNSSTPVTVQAANLYLNNVGTSFYGAGTGKITVACGSVVTVSPGTLLLPSASTASFDVSGGPFSGSGTRLFRPATQAVRVNSPSFAVDISKLTPTDGDIVNNTNSGLSCGAGLVVYHAGGTGNGWKNVYSGATY